MAEALKHNLKLIGRYAILRELRRDRYTAAYLALDPVLNREVVVKAVQLRPAPGQETTGHDRIDQAFTRQAQAAGRLVHPHIVSVFDAGRVQNIGYLALEKVNGKLLGTSLADGYRPSCLEVADIAARVADAVEYAHARGVPHGHLSASRVYLQEPERVPKVMGFGGWIDTGVTGDFELAATEAMLPYFENELGAEARRKDVRALGALLFLLLTGTRPGPKVLSAGRNSGGIVLELQPSTPPTLAEIAEGALELRETPSYGSAGQMRDALTAFLWSQREAQALASAATLPRSAARADTVVRPSPATLPAALPVGTSREAAPSRQRVFRASAVGALLVGLVAIVIVGVRDADDPPASPKPARTGATTQSPASVPIAINAQPTAATPLPATRTSAQTTHFGPAPASISAASATNTAASAGPAVAPASATPASRSFQ